uniref:Uncharacterized protein n=1 Tax=viral metagenome TaxID=1070528 RepID=A0A6C0J940_9ZZZZ
MKVIGNYDSNRAEVYNSDKEFRKVIVRKFIIVIRNWDSNRAEVYNSDKEFRIVIARDVLDMIPI